MKIKKIQEYIENMEETETKTDFKVSNQVFKIYYDEFKKSNDIWKALKDAANILDMNEKEVYNHIVNIGEGSIFEKSESTSFVKTAENLISHLQNTIDSLKNKINEAQNEIDEIQNEILKENK